MICRDFVLSECVPKVKFGPYWVYNIYRKQDFLLKKCKLGWTHDKFDYLLNISTK